MEEFGRRARESKFGRVGRALPLLESVLESYDEIASVIDRGVDFNKNSRARIEHILSAGGLELRMADRASFEFRVLRDGQTKLDPHDFDDLFSFAKIKINQNPDRPVQCFRDFFDVFSDAHQLVQRLDSMLRHGLIPDQSLLGRLELASQRCQLERRIETADARIREWKLELRRQLESCDQVERFFLEMFRGFNLAKLSRQNLAHYLRLFSCDLQLNLNELPGQAIDLGDSRAKIDYLKKLLAENTGLISENILNKKQRLLSRNRLNYVRVSEDKTHQFLLYLYAERLGEQLECGRLLFARESTAWETIQSTRPLIHRLHLSQYSRSEPRRVLCFECLASAGVSGQADASGVLGLSCPGKAFQRGFIPRSTVR